MSSVTTEPGERKTETDRILGVLSLQGGFALEILFMDGRRPTYQELERRVQELEETVSKSKDPKEALRESEQIREEVINAIPVRVFWKDLNLAYLGCNTLFARDAGLDDPSEIIGKNDYDLAWRDQADLYRADDRQIIADGAPKLLIEEPQTTPEGKTITLLTSKIPLSDSHGTITGVLGTYMDITDRKQAEDALRLSEAKYRLLFENMTNGFALHEMVLDDQGEPVDYVFLEINSAFERITGLRKDDLIGKRVTEVLPGIENEPADWVGRYAKVALENQEARFEEYSRSIDKWFSVIAFSPRRGCFATLVTDITERILADQEKERLISDLQNALRRVKQLSGMLPICAHCKKIRDDKGYWNQIETYIHDHSEADFSHSICQECAKKHYPGIDIYEE